MKTLLFVVNALEYFVSHRLAIALAAQKAGYAVHVASPDSLCIPDMVAYGFSHHVVPFERSGQNPMHELKNIMQLVRLFRCIRPDLVHLLTIKPVFYGGIAARLVGVPALLAAVTGLGTVFMSSSFKFKARLWVVKRLYKAAFLHPNLAVIFQNPDDRDVLLNWGVLDASCVRMIRGSGVNMDDYHFEPEPDGKPIVVMAARLLRDKGVFEYVEAARLLHARGVAVEVRLIGATDAGNLTSVTEDDLKRWATEGNVRLLGFRTDIVRQYAQANIVCLPSYREGLPKGLIEAAACGRAVVTTDVAGCRDAITPGVTGMLVPVKDAVALADALQQLIQDASMRRRMGQAGRLLAEEVFAIEKIVAQHMAIYNELVQAA